MAATLRKALSRATITATKNVPSMSTTRSGSVLCCRKSFSALTFHDQTEGNNTRTYSTKQRYRSKSDNDDFDSQTSPPPSIRSGKNEYSGDPDLYRIFFRSPDKMRSLEEAQVFINHIKSSYGPLTQYQFARCPETKRYFGYGFVTFKNKDSLDKAMSDAYIRVGMKDFELIRTENTRHQKPVKFRKTGFSGFHDLEELRAKKREEEDRILAQSIAQGETVAETKGQETGDSKDTKDTGSIFVSALPSSSTDAGTSAPSDNSTATDGTSVSSSSASPKPYFIPLQKKGMAQLWKIIPREIERAEQTSKQADGSEQEPTVPKVDNKKLAAALVGDILDTKP
ncbi:hypothetical protein BGX33_001550 [Mortierella sp. NVP41]|nr:hypothetical protein BGX33_001550 [Mortierella sp. NVP41]